MKIAESIPKKC